MRQNLQQQISNIIEVFHTRVTIKTQAAFSMITVQNMKKDKMHITIGKIWKLFHTYVCRFSFRCTSLMESFEEGI